MSFRRFFRRRYWDDERAREIEAHLAHEIDENVARGMTPESARRAAYRTFGNPTVPREAIYRMNTIGWLEAARFDLRDAVRLWRRRPLAAVGSVVLLALGIGASTAAFAIAYGVLWRPLPFPDAPRLVTVWQHTRGEYGQVSYPDLRDLRRLDVFDGVAAMLSGRGTLTAGDDVDRITVADVESGLLPMLGARPGIGRLLGAGDAGRPLAVLSHRLWRRLFDGDPAAVGRSIILSGHPFTVVGALAADPPFELPVGGAALGVAFTIEDVDLWTPLDPADPMAGSRAISTYEVVARLAPGTTRAAAQAAVDGVASALARQFAGTNAERGFSIVGLRDQIVAPRRMAIVLGLGGAILLLFVACANAVSLTLGELPLRQRDGALRVALGAGRGRLLRQAAWESALLAGIAGLSGMLLARALLGSLTASVALPRESAVRVDLPVVSFAVGIAALAAFAARALPLLRLDSGPSTLRASTSTHAASAPRLRRWLVIGELGLAVFACGTGALLGASLFEVSEINPGFIAHHALSARVSAYPVAHPGKAEVVRFFGDLLSSLRRTPGVESAGAGTSLPLSETNTGTVVMAEGHPLPEAERPTAGWQAVTPGYFAALGMPIRAGRDFEDADVARGGHHVIINEALARRLFGSENPLGRRVADGSQSTEVDWHTIVGVVGDVRHGSLTEHPAPRIYDLFGEHWGRTLYVAIRTRGDAAAAAPVVRDAVRRLDGGAPVFDVRTLDQAVNSAAEGRRIGAIFAGGIGATTLLLAMIGVYALLASAVTSRSREIGIRRALGCPSRRIASTIAGEALGMSFAGVLAGLGMLVACRRLLDAQLYGVSATDPRMLAAVATLLTGVAVLAAVLPARRAARVDPASILKAD